MNEHLSIKICTLVEKGLCWKRYYTVMKGVVFMVANKAHSPTQSADKRKCCQVQSGAQLCPLGHLGSESADGRPFHLHLLSVNLLSNKNQSNLKNQQTLNPMGKIMRFSGTFQSPLR